MVCGDITLVEDSNRSVWEKHTSSFLLGLRRPDLSAALGWTEARDKS